MVPMMRVDVEDGPDIVTPEICWDMMADLDVKERWERGGLVGRRTIERSLSIAERSLYFGSPRPTPKRRFALRPVRPRTRAVLSSH